MKKSKNLYLDTETIQKLEELKGKYLISESSIIGRLIDEFYHNQKIERLFDYGK